MSKTQNARGSRRRAKQRAATKGAREAAAVELGPVRPSQTRITELIAAGAGGWDNGEPWLNPERVWAIDPDHWFPASTTDDELAMYRRLETAPPVTYFLNAIYQVAFFEEPSGGEWPDMWHLSIKRRDREPLDENRWRILQRIKNELVDPECEAIELYPAESRLVDTANQMHLWCLKVPGMRFPFGFQSRLVTNEPGDGAVQRDTDATPEDEADFAETVARFEATDTHRAAVAKILGIPPEEVTPEQLREARHALFGQHHQASPATVSAALGLSDPSDAG